MDPKDRQILQILQEDAKISNVKLSELIGLTPPATLERVKKLEESGYIVSYNARVDHSKLGYAIPVFIAVTLVKHQQKDIDEFIAFLKNTPEIIGFFHLTGAYDYLLKVQTKDIKDLQHFLLTKLTKITSIDKAETFVILEEHISPSPIP